MPGDVGLIAELLTKVFGFVVDPSGLATMKREHQLEVIHSGIKIGVDQGDWAAVHLLFQQLRELRDATS